MPSNKHGFVHIVLLVLVVSVFVLGTGYFAYKNGQIRIPSSNISLNSPTPTPNLTNEWEVFSDDKYDFEFKIPKYFNIPDTGLWSEYMDVDYSTIDLRQDAGLEESTFLDRSGERYSKSILMEMSKDDSLDNWKTKSKFSSSHKFITEEKMGDVLTFTTLVLGQTGYIDNDRVTGFAVHDGGKVLVIAIRHYSANQKESELFRDQILSTFKFINANNSKVTNAKECNLDTDCYCYCCQRFVNYPSSNQLNQECPLLNKLSKYPQTSCYFDLCDEYESNKSLRCINNLCIWTNK